MLLIWLAGITFAANVIGDVPTSASENRIIKNETTLYTSTCDIVQELWFYKWSPVYLRVGQPKWPVSYVFDKVETYVRVYNADIFVGSLKFPYISNFVPSTTIESNSSNILTVDAKDAVFTWSTTIPRNQIAGQLVTVNNERSVIVNANWATLNYYYILANDMSSHNGSLKAILNPSLTKKIACTSYYVARCGDSVIDKATGTTDGNWGIFTQWGTFLEWHPNSIKPNEICDDWVDNGKSGKCKIDCTGIDWWTGENPTGSLTVNKTIVWWWTIFAEWDNILFRIDFNNQSNQTINNVKIEDILPYWLSYVSSEIHGATNSIFSTGMEAWNFKVNYTGFSLSSGQNWYVLINTKMVSCNSSTNFAFWSWWAWSGVSSITADCASTAILAFSKTIDKANLVLWETVWFNILVTNNIWKAMNNVIIKDLWPSNNCINIVWAPADSTWNIGNLGINIAQKISFSGLVSNNVACAGTHTNTAKIDYTTDGAAKTTTTTVSFNIAAITQNMSITKTRIWTDPVWPGSDVIFEIEYRNNWINNIIWFKVIDTLSDAFDYISSVVNWQQPVSFPMANQRKLIWDFFGKTLAPGEWWKIELKLRIK